jgi:hypothetical protein
LLFATPAEPVHGAWFTAFMVSPCATSHFFSLMERIELFPGVAVHEDDRAEE